MELISIVIEMKITQNKSQTVMVMCGGGGTCPRVVLSEGKISARLHDDYYGRVKIGRNLLKKLNKV